MLNHKEILNLCERTLMPEPMTAKISHELDTFDFTEAATFIPDIINPKTAWYATKKLGGILDGYGLRLLTVSLCAALSTWNEIYKKKGISYRIYIDTMKCFSRFVREYYDINGCYGYGSAFWSWRQLAGVLFRLGTLEFETTQYTGINGGGPIQSGEQIISVHIPSGADLSRMALDVSYRQAREFYAGTEYQNAPFFCESWLLSPKLRELLPDNSNILRFQNDHKILRFHPDNGDDFMWVFKSVPKALEDLPENTTLQRKLKALLLQGGHLGEAEGIIID